MGTIIFGGSFDPIHNGHIGIAQKASDFLHCEKVVFVLAKAPRWKDGYVEAKHRLNMLKIALEDKPWASIDLIEYNSNEEVNYTYNTINKIKDKYEGPLFLLIGTDQLNKLDKWYKVDELGKEVRFVCVVRPDYQVNEENVKKFNVIIIKEAVSDMSSTKARKMLKLELPKKVIDYIIDNDLYFTSILRSYIKEKRYRHSISVANVCYDIAVSNNLNPYQAYLAGLVHDIGKEVSIIEQRKYMEANYQEYVDTLCPALYHQFVGVDVLKKLGLDDEEILEAVKYHATGKANMSLLGRVVYASDKIEPTRGYDSSSMIKACLNDIVEGFKYVLDENIKFLKETNKDFNNPLTSECINYYLGGNN